MTERVQMEILIAELSHAELVQVVQAQLIMLRQNFPRWALQLDLVSEPQNSLRNHRSTEPRMGTLSCWADNTRMLPYPTLLTCL